MICYHCMQEYTGTRCPHCGFEAGAYEPIPTALPPATLLHEQYIVGTVLGKGGFGITYVGYDNLQRHKVAIKEFYPTAVAYRNSEETTEITVPAEQKQIYATGVTRFYEEAVTLSCLQEIPAIVDIYDFFYENNTAYIVMEFVDGTAVDQIVLQQGGLDVDLTLTIYYPILQALQKVHAAGILHRDISPSNIMLDGHFCPRLIDFGSSRAYSHELSTDLTVILKKGFAPIEQYSRKGKHGPAEDVYALCASMYYTMTGKVPPAAPDRRVFDTLEPIHKYRADVPAELAHILMKGLSVLPEDRYPDMTALCDAIDQSIHGESPKVDRPLPQKPAKKQHSNRSHASTPIAPYCVLIAAGVLFLLLLGILLAMLLGMGSL